MAFNTDGVFAGMESIMEGDVEINNEVQVPAEETAEAVADTIDNEETAAEGAEIVEDAETEEVKDQMIANNFGIMLNMYEVAKTRGIDSTFLALFDRDGGLSRMVNVQFPSCESMDAIGNPNSSYSQAFVAAMEADDGIFTKIWEWIKKVCAKIRDFFVRIWDWVASAFGSITRKIGTLQSRLDNAEPKDLNDLKGKKVNVYNIDKTKAANDKVLATIKEIVGDGKEVTSEIAIQITAATAAANRGNTAKKQKKYDAKLNKMLGKVKTAFGKIEKKEYKADEFITSPKIKDLKDMLQDARDLVEGSASFKNAMQDMKTNAERTRAAAERAQQMQTGKSLTSADLQDYKDDIKSLSKVSSAVAKAVAYAPKLAGYNCQVVANVLSVCYKVKGGTGPDSSKVSLNNTK